MDHTAARQHNDLSSFSATNVHPLFIQSLDLYDPCVTAPHACSRPTKCKRMLDVKSRIKTRRLQPLSRWHSRRLQLLDHQERGLLPSAARHVRVGTHLPSRLVHFSTATRASAHSLSLIMYTTEAGSQLQPLQWTRFSLFSPE